MEDLKIILEILGGIFLAIIAFFLKALHGDIKVFIEKVNLLVTKSEVQATEVTNLKDRVSKIETKLKI
ncbi:MAG: hypothetical protein MUC49_14805 [Raineya sp.]|jgi:hypothetical protein|nr:hypothetical protein [Raineya sp.]